MSDATSLSLEQATWRPAANPWLIAVTVSLAAFMEVLDTAIANVALPHIAGNLGASNDQSTWVLTSYLVANAIILPDYRLAGEFVRTQAFLHDLHGDFYRQLTVLWNRPQALAFCCCFACFKVQEAEACSPWRRPFSRTLFLRRSVAWHFLFTALQRFVLPRSVRLWAVGLPILCPGDGSS